MSRQPYSYDRVYNGGEVDPYARAPPPAAARGSHQAYILPGETRRLLVAKCPDQKLAYSNRLVVSDRGFGPRVRLVKVNERFVFSIQRSTACAPGEIGPAVLQRQWAQLSIGQEVTVEALDDAAAGATSGPAGVFLSRMEVELSFMWPNQETPLVADAEEVAAVLQSSFENMVFSVGQLLVLDVRGYTLKAAVTGLSGVPLDVLQGTAEAGGEAAACGVLSAATDVVVAKAAGSLIELKGAAAKRRANAIIQPDFRFEDLGIGGLDTEFSSIFRRAFASRIFPAELVDRLGIQHVKGILLYGPPGTGKTLMARQIGKMLNAVEPLVVSGPEVLNKFVGQSEENVRKLFEPAEKEYRERGDDSQLHIIIFDELDAICKQRGSRSDSTGVGDSVVNQLLAKMDGVDQLNNILLIGMTNRKELIDDALLRPGRLEVHIEIGLPDESGRLQILKIHTAKIRENGILAPDVDLAELAAQTRNFSGAEIAALVKSASSYAFTRHVKVGSTAELSPDVSEMTIQRQDFANALDEVKPAFGAAAGDLELYLGSGIIEFAPHVHDALHKSHLFAEQVRQSSRSPLVSLLLHGPAGSGKTALAATIAQQSTYPFVRLVSPEAMVGFTDSQKVTAITKVFHDAYKSPLSLIVVDDIERLLEWVPIGARFSNAVLQTLLVLVKKHPPAGHRLFVIATTSERDILAQMDLAAVFSGEIYIESICTLEALEKVICHARLFDSTREYDMLFAGLGDYLNGRSFSISVKKLLLLVETARQDPDRHSRFMSELCAIC
ncbi:transport between ER and Golgi ATPase protein [Coemansia biformis]|uniref:Vesicular-fusion protein SEC18 n=1 Tax=Coemansia biformis TaxID=1286918 RepID=A0A9W7Y4K8_9FUNG|nr:transport between ER and Golgi ATPase protein [Coemansia biformis]